LKNTTPSQSAWSLNWRGDRESGSTTSGRRPSVDKRCSPKLLAALLWAAATARQMLFRSKNQAALPPIQMLVMSPTSAHFFFQFDKVSNEIFPNINLLTLGQ
jgi:hypothetical protein